MIWRLWVALAWAGWIGVVPLFAQLDPERRQLLQFAYNQPLEGKGPLAAYAFYYYNNPDFLRSNLTFRAAIAPIYIDAELGFEKALGERTDLGLGFSGGGFADSYFEVRQGKLWQEESFTGHGGEIAGSLYHLFNPDSLIPLNAVLRSGIHYSTFERDDETDIAFQIPDDRTSIINRAGLRWGGREPITFPDLAMELSVWYENHYRFDHGRYGYSGDRKVEDLTHLFWTRALLIYTLPEWKHNIGVSVTVGTALDADRFSSFRLGGLLPLVSEFPLLLPGYYYQEISSEKFALINAQYTIPLGKGWNITTVGSVANVDYLPGLQQAGSWHSGIGFGLGYKSKSEWWRVVIGYSYGFDAIRDHGRGAQSIGFLCQIDLEAALRDRSPYFDAESPYKSRGLFRLFRP